MNIEPWFNYTESKLRQTWKLQNILNDYILMSVSINHITMRNRFNDWYVVLVPKRLSNLGIIQKDTFDGSIIYFDGFILDESTPFIPNVIISCKSVWGLMTIHQHLRNMSFDRICNNDGY